MSSDEQPAAPRRGEAVVLAGLRATLAKMECALSSLAEAIVWTDGEGTVQWCNRAFDELAGRPHIQVLGKCVRDFFVLRQAGKPVPQEENPLFGARACGGLCCDIETPNGIVLVEIQSRKLQLTAREDILIFVIRDVTQEQLALELQRSLREQAAAQERAEELNRQLFHADRLKAIGQLASGVAHEVNNPLTYIIGNLDHLAAVTDAFRADPNQGLPADLEEVIEETRHGAERISRIVRDLKVFSRSEQDQDDRSIDVRDTLDVALTLLGNEIHHRATLKRDYRSTPSVRCSESRLAQVFVNLLANAAQALSEGHSDEDEIRVCTRSDDQRRAIIEIHDTGSGIDPRDVPRAFEPFFTTKPVGEGTGLGLSICHGLVVGMGGTIEIESDVGSGTCVRVTLPGSVDSPAARSQTGRRLKDTAVGRLLVVDDDPAVARSIVRMLRAHEVVVVNSGHGALEKFTSDRGFDVVFCDLMMPDLTGMAVYERVCELYPGLAERFVFITGGAFTASAKRFVRTVPNLCLDKPLDLASVRDVIQRFVSSSARNRKQSAG